MSERQTDKQVHRVASLLKRNGLFKKKLINTVVIDHVVRIRGRTIRPRRLAPLYILVYYIKCVKTSRKYSIRPDSDVYTPITCVSALGRGTAQSQLRR